MKLFRTLVSTLVLAGCGPTLADEDEVTTASTSEALTCSFYSENFDDSVANEGTFSTHAVGWCDTYVAIASNTPPCLPIGKTLRTNSGTLDPTIWVRRGKTSCTGVRVTYSYYQFADAATSLTYSASGDITESCEKSGAFSTATLNTGTQVCQSKSVLIPFGTLSSNDKSLYIRFEHPSTNVNAIWFDSVTLAMEGCSC